MKLFACIVLLVIIIVPIYFIVDWLKQVTRRMRGREIYRKEEERRNQERQIELNYQEEIKRSPHFETLLKQIIINENDLPYEMVPFVCSVNVLYSNGTCKTIDNIPDPRALLEIIANRYSDLKAEYDGDYYVGQLDRVIRRGKENEIRLMHYKANKPKW